MVYLIDFLYTLPPKVDVRIKFQGKRDTFSFTTGKRKTRDACDILMVNGEHNTKIATVYPLFHAQEVYIECI